MQDEQIQALSRAIWRSHGSRWARLIKSPAKIVTSCVMRSIATWIGRHWYKRVQLFWGQPMLVVFPELCVTRDLYRYGFWEEGLTRMMLEYMRPGMVLYDVGAHFGYFSLLGSHLVGATGHVHSFEPITSTFKVLQSNVAQCHNVQANNLAVFSHRTTITMYDYGLAHSGFNSAYKGRMGELLNRKLRPYGRQVQAISLDEYMEQTGSRPDFVKLDAEGAENEIFQGMGKLLTEVRPLITLEVGDITHLVRSEDWIRYFTERGYRPMEYLDGRIGAHCPRTHYTYDNLLFVPEESGARDALRG